MCGWCVSAGSGVLWAWARGHEENPATHRRQPAGLETHGGRAEAGISDSGGGTPENAWKTEGGIGQGDRWGSRQPGQVSQAPVVTRCRREQHQGGCEPEKQKVFKITFMLHKYELKVHVQVPVTTLHSYNRAASINTSDMWNHNTEVHLTASLIRQKHLPYFLWLSIIFIFLIRFLRHHMRDKQTSCDWMEHFQALLSTGQCQGSLLFIHPSTLCSQRCDEIDEM